MDANERVSRPANMAEIEAQVAPINKIAQERAYCMRGIGPRR